MPYAWRECVGTGRLNLALRADYQESAALVQREIGFRYIRGHGLLSDDMGVLRESQGVTRYTFTYVDQVVDSWLRIGLKPFLELGFMPSALASGDQTVFWWKGNVTPPRSHDDWAALVRAVLRHLIDRYGLEEVRTWPIEVWNEPNLTVFWEGADQAAYFRLYEATARAVKDVDASLQVGGPVLSPGSDEWWAPFADFVAARDVPIDFVSRHAYSSGPAQQVPFGVYQTFERPQALLDQFDAPRRHLEGTALAGLPVHISEFNTSYRPDNPVHDTAWNAAYLAPVLAGGGDLVDSFSYWTFCDVFEEADIPTSLFHGGFGLLTHRQVRKPTYHLYAFMARMGASVLARGEDHLVCRDDDGRVTVLAWQPVGGSDDGPYGSAPATHEVRAADAGPVGRGRRPPVGERDRGQRVDRVARARPAAEPVRARARPAARRLRARRAALLAVRRRRPRRPRPGARAARGDPGRAAAGDARRAPGAGRRDGSSARTWWDDGHDDEARRRDRHRPARALVGGRLLVPRRRGDAGPDRRRPASCSWRCSTATSATSRSSRWRACRSARRSRPPCSRGGRSRGTGTCPRRGTSGAATGSTSSTCCAGGCRPSAVLAVVAVNLTHLGAAGLPPVLGVALGGGRAARPALVRPRPGAQRAVLVPHPRRRPARRVLPGGQAPGHARVRVRCWS